MDKSPIKNEKVCKHINSNIYLYVIIELNIRVWDGIGSKESEKVSY